jgi:hypothetical protein
VARAIWYNHLWVFPLWTKLVAFIGGVTFLLLLFTARVPIEQAARLFVCLSVVALSSAVPLVIGAPEPSYMLETEVTWPLWAFLGVQLVIYWGWTVGRRHFVPGGLFATEVPRMPTSEVAPARMRRKSLHAANTLRNRNKS